MYIKNKRFISPRVLFWFLPNLRRMEVLKDTKYSKFLSLPSIGKNQNLTLGKINVYVYIHVYIIYNTYIYIYMCVCVYTYMYIYIL